FPVGHRDNLRAGLCQQIRRHGTDVAEPLDADAQPVDVESDMLGGLARNDHDAASRRFAPAERSTHLDRLCAPDRPGRAVRLPAGTLHSIGLPVTTAVAVCPTCML